VDDQEKHRYCTNKFIELANELKDEEISPALVSGALMTASGIYATYVAAGNQGALEPSGVDKVAALYRRTLEHYQETKKARLQAAQAESSEN
jgi:DNA-binding NtrC family response regulator